ncbi:MAG: alpha/beta fold hydrolase, partial [Candidatus Aenigmatarchaeota archaeon]
FKFLIGINDDMKNAIILHGTGGNPNTFWYPYLKRELEKRGFEVWVPQLPNSDNLKEVLEFVMKNGNFTEETVVIGHSAGCPLVLSVLENIKIKVKKAILVAGFTTPLPNDAGNPLLQKKYDWEKIKQNAKEMVFINSDDDPWKHDDKQGRMMFDKLGGTLIILHGQGHMGSDTFKQSYKEFPLLVKLVD